MDLPSARTMPDLYTTLRKKGGMDWNNLRTNAVKCAVKAQEKGYTYYGVQFYGECYGASGNPPYDKYGEATPAACPYGKRPKVLLFDVVLCSDCFDRLFVSIFSTIVHLTFLYFVPHTVLYCTALHCTVLHCTVLYCTVLYCNVM